eukprot:TRINITY_DN21030_c0_g2_i1.p1 TRINITY_DN21030_c0_g2~~TRINITY_DN21030_c0_g2_i1.p1  ORF type:complete len:295 (-),score=65.16 TRINITY_DN21030_c0_g2_i1:614-1498(-)
MAHRQKRGASETASVSAAVVEKKPKPQRKVYTNDEIKEADPVIQLMMTAADTNSNKRGGAETVRNLVKDAVKLASSPRLVLALQDAIENYFKQNQPTILGKRLDYLIQQYDKGAFDEEAQCVRQRKSTAQKIAELLRLKFQDHVFQDRVERKLDKQQAKSESSEAEEEEEGSESEEEEEKEKEEPNRARRLVENSSLDNHCSNSDSASEPEAQQRFCSGKCDVCNVDLLPGAGWYHKPPFDDLCKTHWMMQDQVSQQSFVNILSEKDLGDACDEYLSSDQPRGCAVDSEDSDSE